MAGILSVSAWGPDQPVIPDKGKVEALYRSGRSRVMVAATGGYALSYTCRRAM